MAGYLAKFASWKESKVIKLLVHEKPVKTTLGNRFAHRMCMCNDSKKFSTKFPRFAVRKCTWGKFAAIVGRLVAVCLVVLGPKRQTTKHLLMDVVWWGQSVATLLLSFAHLINWQNVALVSKTLFYAQTSSHLTVCVCVSEITAREQQSSSCQDEDGFIVSISPFPFVVSI